MASERLELIPGAAAAHLAAADDTGKTTSAFDPVDWRSRVVSRSLGTAADRAVRRGLALISAAGRLVQKSGGDDFTMQQVASEAGLSLRVLYQHFSGKDDLLVALIEESQHVFVTLLKRHAGRREDPLECLGAALYFAIDSRQHPDPAYNAALARYTTRTSMSAPEQLGRARRPVIELFTEMITDAMVAGLIDDGDPERAATTIYLALGSHAANTYLGNSMGGRLPSNEAFLRFAIQGIGADLPLGWEEQFRISDEEAHAYHLEAEYASGTRPRPHRNSTDA